MLAGTECSTVSKTFKQQTLLVSIPILNWLKQDPTSAATAGLPSKLENDRRLYIALLCPTALTPLVLIAPKKNGFAIGYDISCLLM